MKILNLILCVILPFTLVNGQIESSFQQNIEDDIEMEFKLQGDIETAIQQEIQQEISSEMDEVQMWIKLYEAVDSEYIDIESYPSELSKYMQHQMVVIDEYLTLVEEAEISFYDGGDYQLVIDSQKIN